MFVQRLYCTALIFISCSGLFSACQQTTSTTDARCEITVDTPTENWVLGTEVTLSAHPMTDLFDTLVQINDTTIDAIALNTAECASCDLCREESGCNDCASCIECSNLCQDCRHHLTLRLPESLPTAESYSLTLFNSLGTSSPITIQLSNSIE